MYLTIWQIRQHSYWTGFAFHPPSQTCDFFAHLPSQFGARKREYLSRKQSSTIFDFVRSLQREFPLLPEPIYDMKMRGPKALAENLNVL